MNGYKQNNYVEDKVIIITGASAGFGAALAKKASAMGAKVVLAARREERLAALTEEIRAAGGTASYVVTDVRSREMVENMVRFTLDTYGRVDVLVNDAGTMPLSFFSEHELAMEAWEECIDTSIKGTLYGISAVYDTMFAQGQGHVINVSSILGNAPVLGAGVYNVSKVGVRYLAESLRVEARGRIRVTTVRPTSVPSTELNNTIVSFKASMAGLYGKLFEAFKQNPMTCPDMLNRDSVHYSAPTADDIADKIIYAINQPWGVDISDITVRATGENMAV